MITLLLKKEWTRTIRARLKGARGNVFGTIVNIVIAIGLFAFILFLFNALNEKFTNYGVSDKLLTFTLGLTTVIYSLTAMVKIDKNTYDSNDLTLSLSLPLKSRDVVISKLAGTYIRELISMSPLVLALFITYGLRNGFTPIFIVTMLLSLIALPCFVLFYATLLSLPYHYVKQFMSNHTVVQLVFAIAVVALFSYIYSNVLNVFIELINDGRLAYLFNDNNMSILSIVNNFLIPATFITGFALGQNVALNATLLLGLSLVAIGLAVMLLTIFYKWIRNHSNELKQNRIDKKLVVHSKTYALIKKELVTLFRNSNYLFVYCTLLLSLGFINVAISTSLKSLVTRFLGSSFSYFPFAFLILSVFAATINGLGALVISKEKESATLMKTMPVSYRCQIKVKYGILLAMAFVSLLLAGIVMLIANIMPVLDTIILVLSVFFLVASLLTNIVNKDAKYPNFQKNVSDDSKVNYSLLSSLVAPVLFFLIAILAFVFTSKLIMLIAILAISVLVFFLFYYELMKKVTKNMKRMEV